MRQILAWASNNLRVLIVVFFALSTITFTLAWLASSTPTSIGGAPQLQEPIDTVVDANLPSTPLSTETPSLPSTVIVYISGAVSAPDVYELPIDARIKDLVLAAGGLTADADPERINLAERLKDSEHIHVPRQGESPGDGAVVANTTGLAESAEDRLIYNTETGKLFLDVNGNEKGGSRLIATFIGTPPELTATNFDLQ